MSTIPQTTTCTKISQYQPQDVPILKLPRELLLLIFHILDKNDLVNCSATCRQFYVISNLPVVWQKCFQRTFPRSLIPQDNRSKELFQNIVQMHSCALNRMVTCQPVSNVPDKVTWVKILTGGTQVIGKHDRNVCIYDLKNAAYREFTPEGSYTLKKIKDITQFSAEKILLVYANSEGSKTLLVCDLTTEKTSLLCDKCHDVFYLKNDKIGVTFASDQESLTIFDLKKQKVDTHITDCGLTIESAIEYEKGKIALLSGHVLKTWDIDGQIQIGDPFNIEYFSHHVQIEDGSIAMWNARTQRGCTFDPKTRSITAYFNIEEDNPSLFAAITRAQSIQSIDASRALCLHTPIAQSKIQEPEAFFLELDQNNGKFRVDFLNPSLGSDIIVDHAFTSLNEVTLLGKTSIQRLYFGETNGLILNMVLELENKELVQSLLLKISTNLKEKNKVYGSPKFDVQNYLKKLNPENNCYAQLFFQYMDSHNASFSVKIRTLATKSYLKDALYQSDAIDESTSLIQIKPEDKNLFENDVKKLHQIGKISTGFFQRFSLLPSKARHLIYDELAMILEKRLGSIDFSTGEHYFHGTKGQKATDQELTQAMKNYLIKQGIQFLETSSTM